MNIKGVGDAAAVRHLRWTLVKLGIKSAVLYELSNYIVNNDFTTWQRRTPWGRQ